MATGAKGVFHPLGSPEDICRAKKAQGGVNLNSRRGRGGFRTGGRASLCPRLQHSRARRIRRRALFLRVTPRAAWRPTPRSRAGPDQSPRPAGVLPSRLYHPQPRHRRTALTLTARYRAHLCSENILGRVREGGKPSRGRHPNRHPGKGAKQKGGRSRPCPPPKGQSQFRIPAWRIAASIASAVFSVTPRSGSRTSVEQRPSRDRPYFAPASPGSRKIAVCSGISRS